MFQTMAYHVTRFYKDFYAFTSDKLQDLGLHFGLVYFVIYVGKHPGATPSALTKALGVDWGHCQRSLNRLVDGGFMTKEKSGRSYRLHLTALGEDAFAACHEVFHQWDEKWLVPLTDDERRQLLSLIQKITMKEVLHDDV